MEFKTGDRVRITHGVSKGRVGTIDRFIDHYQCVLQIDDYEVYKDTDWLELVNEEKEMKKLKVDTLEFEVEFTETAFRIGCQKVSFEDANKVADFIKEQKKSKLFLRRGSMLRDVTTGCRYVLTKLSNDSALLVNVETGRRYFDAMSLDSLENAVNNDRELEVINA